MAADGVGHVVAVGEAAQTGPTLGPGRQQQGPVGDGLVARDARAGRASRPADGRRRRRRRVTTRAAGRAGGTPRCSSAARTCSAGRGVDHQHQDAPVALGAWAISRSKMLTPSSPSRVVTSASTPGRSGTGTRTSAMLARGGAPDGQVDPRLPGPLERPQHPVAVPGRPPAGARRRRAAPAAGRGTSTISARFSTQTSGQMPGMAGGDAGHVPKAAGRQPQQGGVLGGGVGGQVHQGGRGQVRDVGDHGHQVVVALGATWPPRWRRARRPRPGGGRRRRVGAAGRGQHPRGAVEQLAGRRRRRPPARSRPWDGRRRSAGGRRPRRWPS